MSILAEFKRTPAVLAVWSVAFLALLVWYLFGPDNRWWTTAVYAVVIGAAGLFTIRAWPSGQGGGPTRPGSNGPGPLREPAGRPEP
jgi:hypothetical protein